jgi:glycosyltransferase involved in cell wall biosynthesis
MRKGIIKLINVFSEVCKTEKNVKLLLVGEGPLQKKVEKMIKDFGIQDKVIFLKNLSFDDLKRCYSNADIFTFFPTYEGQGLVIIEAMASGTPCVATAEGGIPEMVTHAKNGYVVQQHEFDKMVKYIKKLLADDELRAKFGIAARKATEEEWDWELVTRKYEKLYKEILASPRHSPLRSGK